MKKLVLLIIVIVSSFTISGQTKKGNWVLSGGAGLQFISSNIKDTYDGRTLDDYKTNSFTFLPSAGYFIIDNLAIELAGNITVNSEKYKNGDKYSTTTTLLMPAAVYYFTLDGKISPFAQIGVGYSSLMYKDTPKVGTEDKSSYGGLAINFGGGVACFVKENVSFNFGLSYTRATLTDRDDTKSKAKQGNFGANIGLSVYFW